MQGNGFLHSNHKFILGAIIVYSCEAVLPPGRGFDARVPCVELAAETSANAEKTPAVAFAAKAALYSENTASHANPPNDPLCTSGLGAALASETSQGFAHITESLSRPTPAGKCVMGKDQQRQHDSGDKRGRLGRSTKNQSPSYWLSQHLFDFSGDRTNALLQQPPIPYSFHRVPSIGDGRPDRQESVCASGRGRIEEVIDFGGAAPRTSYSPRPAQPSHRSDPILNDVVGEQSACAK